MTRRDITNDEPCRVHLDADLIWDENGRKRKLPPGLFETCVAVEVPTTVKRKPRRTR